MTDYGEKQVILLDLTLFILITNWSSKWS